MSDPADAALQKALVSLFVADTDVHAIAADRIYDRIPTSPTFPYVSCGSAQVVDADADCAASVVVFLDVHAWSRAVGRVEASRLAGALRAALRAAWRAGTFTVAGYHVGNIRARDTRIFSDPDGLTTHAVVTFEAHLDPTTA